MGGISAAGRVGEPDGEGLRRVSGCSAVGRVGEPGVGCPGFVGQVQWKGLQGLNQRDDNTSHGLRPEHQLCLLWDGAHSMAQRYLSLLRR